MCLQHLLETEDEAAAAIYMQQDWALFPYSIQHLHIAAYSWLHGLLNPTDDPSSILWHVIEGATPLELALLRVEQDRGHFGGWCRLDGFPDSTGRRNSAAGR